MWSVLRTWRRQYRQAPVLAKPDFSEIAWPDAGSASDRATETVLRAIRTGTGAQYSKISLSSKKRFTSTSPFSGESEA